MTKIDIFSGFLGAGKTTLIKKLIKEAYCGEKVVLIENEFGEIGVDGGFLKDAGVEITEMNSGCICCSLVGDFGEALAKVLEDFAPDRILIEPSGVGKLSDVIKAVGGVLTEEVVLGSATAVVDAVKCKMYLKNFGEFFGNQIENANTIVLSRTDIASEEKIKDAIELIKGKNPSANLITTPIDQLDGKDILAAMEKENGLDKMKTQLEEEEVCPHCGEHHHHHDEECHCHEHHHDEECHCHEHHHEHRHEHHHHDEHCSCGHHHHEHHHHADEVFGSWGVETVKTFTKEQIEKVLSKLTDSDVYGEVLRAKGYVKSENEWIYFDYVPGETDIRSGKPGVTGRICVIGAKISEEALKELFGI